MRINVEMSPFAAARDEHTALLGFWVALETLRERCQHTLSVHRGEPYERGWYSFDVQPH